MGGPKKGMYTLCHSYIFRHCFNVCHSTTLNRRKRVSKVTRNMTSNSGLADFLPSAHNCRQISEQSHHKHYSLGPSYRMELDYVFMFVRHHFEDDHYFYSQASQTPIPIHILNTQTKCLKNLTYAIFLKS